MSNDNQNLRAAVTAIWDGCGEVAPTGANLDAAAKTLLEALKAGRKIPRVLDKTFQPLVGPRRDLET